MRLVEVFVDASELREHTVVSHLVSHERDTVFAIVSTVDYRPQTAGNDGEGVVLH